MISNQQKFLNLPLNAAVRCLLLTIVMLLATTSSQAKQCAQREQILEFLALEQTSENWYQGCIGKDFNNLNADQAGVACSCIVEKTVVAIQAELENLPSGSDVCDADFNALVSDSTKVITETCLEEVKTSQ